MKTCSKCKIEKELEKFSKCHLGKGGLRAQCKECCKQVTENYRKNNLENPSTIAEKICTQCITLKKMEEFCRKITNPDGKEYECKVCKRANARAYRVKNWNAKIAKEKQWRRARIIWLQSHKKKPCIDCGKSYEPYCMDFDHLRDKVKGVTRMALESYSKEQILEEIAKCDLVCVLCHNIRTKNRFDSRGPKKYSKRVLRGINIINQAKNKPCAICGNLYDPCNMQLDHLSHATKLKDVCRLKHAEEKVLLTEIAKCQVLCALCHRRKSIRDQHLRNGIQSLG